MDPGVHWKQGGRRVTLNTRNYLEENEWSYASIGRPRLIVGSSVVPMPFTYEHQGKSMDWLLSDAVSTT
jgi:hypothetical protein